MTYRFLQLSACRLLAVLAAVQLVPALGGGVPGARLATDGRGNSAEVLPPVSSSHGHTYSEWSMKWWQYFLALPAAGHPVLGGDCRNGQSGKVWFLVAGPTAVPCSVPTGTALFFPIINSECSDLEAPPYFGGTAGDRRECAKTLMDTATGLSASIDGDAVTEIGTYRVQSPDFDFSVPDNNVLGVPRATTGKSSADGYYLFLAPLSRGTHRIRVQGTAQVGSDVFTIDTTFIVSVGG